MVNACIYDNIHPVYYIKRFVILQKLMSDPTKKNLSWEKFLPKIKKKTLSKRRKPFKVCCPFFFVLILLIFVILLYYSPLLILSPPEERANAFY